VAPELAIAWGADPARPIPVINAAGVRQFTSTWRGDAFVGCEDGSKTTLDLTYIPIALRSGAELRPLSEAMAIGGERRAYWVHCRDHRSGREETQWASRLVLAAGGLNTQRLLFDARDGHRSLPRLPRTLGRRFSPSGDYVALVWKSALLADSSHGPAVGALSRIVDAAGAHRFALGELGLPAHALPVLERVRRSLRRSTFLFAMGRDASGARLSFDGRGLTTDIARSFDSPLYDEIEAALARVVGGYESRRTILNFLRGRGANGLLTVHPLGGCAMGRTAEDGFTDHRGEVFGHVGLFVADGSLYTRSPGIAPSMTIAALAERQADLMA
jgi:cholesterol oxidase